MEYHSTFGDMVKVLFTLMRMIHDTDNQIYWPTGMKHFIDHDLPLMGQFFNALQTEEMKVYVDYCWLIEQKHLLKSEVDQIREKYL